jgi:hypothetical protein
MHIRLSGKLGQVVIYKPQTHGKLGMLVRMRVGVQKTLLIGL